jgi:isoquinoline 1-oxidoreductase subunit beta
MPLWRLSANPAGHRSGGVQFRQEGVIDMAKLSRRIFMIGSALAGGGLAVGYLWARRPWPDPLKGRLAAGEIALNPWIKIGADGVVTLITPRAEMGQGAQTGLAQLLAEELDVKVESIRVEHGPADRAYMNWAITRLAIPFGQEGKGFSGAAAGALLPVVAKLSGHQITGGSSSLKDGFDSLRTAGAAARQMLIAAASARTKIPADKITTDNGFVIAGTERIAYGALAGDAAKLKPPAKVALKLRAQWKVIGKSIPRTDLLSKVTGAPIYGLDVVLPNMLHATVRMNPMLGAAMTGLDATKAKAMAGVVAVVDLSSKVAGGGFGVIADNTWRAFQAADAVKPTWAAAAYPPTTDALFARLTEALDTKNGHDFRRDGDADGAVKSAQSDNLANKLTVVEAEYRAPFLAHTAMEPMTATALIDKGKLTLWTGTQVPTLLIEMAKREFGYRPENVEVVTTFLGGGFGRRLELDYSRYAIMLAKAVEGRPVKVTWTREEDVTHDFYRPAAIARFKGAVGPEGIPVALRARIASPSVGKPFVARILPDLPLMGPDKLIAEGAFDQPYAIANYHVEGLEVDLGVPVGNWRSVGCSQNAFFHETFLDELSRAGKIDPLTMRLKLMEKRPAERAVLAQVAAMSGWGKTPKAPGTGRGMAATRSFGSMCAQVVEIVDQGGALRVSKVWAAIDVGTAVNPALIRRQVESAIVYGLSAAMFEEITFKDGAVQQSSFTDFEALRMNQMPQVEVAVMEVQEHLGGVGEPGLPPVIPALGNAIFDLTGKRLRSTPFAKGVKFTS